MHPRQRILDWLDAAFESDAFIFDPDSRPDCGGRPKRKRQQTAVSQLVSPPGSQPRADFMSEADYASRGTASPASKRRRRLSTHAAVDNVEGELEETPRPKRTANMFDVQSTPSFQSRSHSQSQSTSQQSGASSPRKKLAAMGLGPEGVEVRALTGENMSLPDSLVELLADMELICRGTSVISDSLRVSSLKHSCPVARTPPALSSN